MRTTCVTIFAAAAVAAGLSFGAAGGDDVVIENMELMGSDPWGVDAFD